MLFTQYEFPLFFAVALCMSSASLERRAEGEKEVGALAAGSDIEAQRHAPEVLHANTTAPSRIQVGEVEVGVVRVYLAGVIEERQLDAGGSLPAVLGREVEDVRIAKPEVLEAAERFGAADVLALVELRAAHIQFTARKVSL